MIFLSFLSFLSFLLFPISFILSLVKSIARFIIADELKSSKDEIRILNIKLSIAKNDIEVVKFELNERENEIEKMKETNEQLTEVFIQHGKCRFDLYNAQKKIESLEKKLKASRSNITI